MLNIAWAGLRNVCSTNIPSGITPVNDSSSLSDEAGLEG